MNITHFSASLSKSSDKWTLLTFLLFLDFDLDEELAEDPSVAAPPMAPEGVDGVDGGLWKMYQDVSQRMHKWMG